MELINIQILQHISNFIALMDLIIVFVVLNNEHIINELLLK